MGLQTIQVQRAPAVTDSAKDDLGTIMRDMIKDDPSLRLKILALLDDLTIHLS